MSARETEERNESERKEDREGGSDRGGLFPLGRLDSTPP